MGKGRREGLAPPPPIVLQIVGVSRPPPSLESVLRRTVVPVLYDDISASQQCPCAELTHKTA